jgi:hypothetical protein
MFLMKISGCIPDDFDPRDFQPIELDCNNFLSIVGHVTTILEELGTVSFLVEGFGDDRWPVDVGTDLCVVLEQLPDLWAWLSEDRKECFELDFFEQGMARKLVLVPSKGNLAAWGMPSYITADPWNPEVWVEVMSRDYLREQVRDLWAGFVAFAESVCLSIVRQQLLLSQDGDLCLNTAEEHTMESGEGGQTKEIASTGYDPQRFSRESGLLKAGGLVAPPVRISLIVDSDRFVFTTFASFDCPSCAVHTEAWRHKFIRRRSDILMDNQDVASSQFWVGVECVNCRTLILLDVWAFIDSSERVASVDSADIVFPLLQVALEPTFKYLPNEMNSLLRGTLEELDTEGSTVLAVLSLRSVLESILIRWESENHAEPTALRETPNNDSGSEPSLSERIKYFAAMNEHHPWLGYHGSKLSVLMRRLRDHGDNAFRVPLSNGVTREGCEPLMQTIGLISLLLS